MILIFFVMDVILSSKDLCIVFKEVFCSTLKRESKFKDKKHF